MARIALIETKPSRQKHLEFDFVTDRFALCSDPSKKKVLKGDVDLEIDVDDFDWVILVGSEPTKYFTKITSVTEYSGKVVDKKFIPLINPAMLSFKPEMKQKWKESIESAEQYVTGQLKQKELSEDKIYGITDSRDLYVFLDKAIDSDYDFIALDCETTALYPRDGYMLGFSLSYEPEHGAYVSADCIDEKAEHLMQLLFDKKRVVFHNAKFDLGFFEFHFGFKFPRFEDTMLLHYVNNEQPGTHGLKQLSLKYTDYGDYEKPMYDWIEQYRKQHGILKDSFQWEMIPFDIMKKYAAMDAVCTFILFQKFEEYTKDKKFYKVYTDILLPACRFLTDVQDNGVPFDKERLWKSTELMQTDIEQAIEKLYEFKEVKEFEEKEQKEFNPNSTIQLRSLLFDYLGLEPTSIKTSTGATSTNQEALNILSESHDVPKLILDIRQKVKIKNTYLDKIIPALNRDGRLSSSGKLNMQQIPRDNPIVKGCIKAKPGNKIVAMDLTTAEVYVAAVLANDKNLQDVFRQGGNFHSTIAKLVFNLPCEVDDVAEYYSVERQQAKAVTFGIMYGAGAYKISEQVTKDSGKYFSKSEAEEVIRDYFTKFYGLKKWLDDRKAFISQYAYDFSYFGRKRRLPNVKSDNKGIVAHEIRSGINSLVQSAASDINLLGAIDCHNELKNVDYKANIFALVHDSILAEVEEAGVDRYKELLRDCVQRDRGLSIPGCPIGCDFEVGDDYSMGKFEEKYL
ncbi:DNA polymerase [Phenylobacterium sp.]|uniref:DNA polymerase n=1 Tax=Phenylobacterium sp. TaxID=1871053 RepID=UPI000C93AD3F|nr:DNA polymerase [Phenylobacterium sp.]MAK80312.1 DNA polymerase [Phenylobacterium sp.]